MQPSSRPDWPEGGTPRLALRPLSRWVPSAGSGCRGHARGCQCRRSPHTRRTPAHPLLLAPLHPAMCTGTALELRCPPSCRRCDSGPTFFKATVILAGGGALTGETLLIHLGHFVSLEKRLFLTRAPWRTSSAINVEVAWKSRTFLMHLQRSRTLKTRLHRLASLVMTRPFATGL